MAENTPFPSAWLPDELLTRLVKELDDETVRAIILHGSYARGDAVPPYSDVDLVRITQETPERRQDKRFLWYEGYLLNLSSRPLSIYRDWLTIPQEALFRITTIREARILLEKDDGFRCLQQEAQQWSWEPLQAAANAYASQLLVELSEVILRTLGALHWHKRLMLVERILLHILPTVTQALAVQRGVVIAGNTYLRQVQETVGMTSAWTQYYLQAAGVAADGRPSLSLEQRGRAALRLYQETARLLASSLATEHRETIDHLLSLIDEMLEEHIP